MPLPTNRPPDGVNLLPYLTGAVTNAPNPQLFWRMGGGRQLAIRAGDSKLVRLRSQPDALFDLAGDLGETQDLAGRRTNEVRRLGAGLDGWNKTLVPPAFSGLAGHAANPKNSKQLVEP